MRGDTPGGTGAESKLPGAIYRDAATTSNAVAGAYCGSAKA